jgi:lipoprotein-releasing system permease protein
MRYLSPVERGIDGRLRLASLSSNKSLSSILGLALGSCVLLIVLSIVNGFEREMRERILAVLPHVVLYHHEGIENWQEIDEIIQKSNLVKPLAIAPLQSFQALLINQNNLAAISVNGILPEAEKQVSIIDQLMLSGTLNSLNDKPFGIILGSKLAQKLAVSEGDKVKVMLPEAKISLLGVLPRYRQFEVVGIFEVGAVMDGQIAYIHINDAAKLMRNKGKVPSLRLLMPDLFNAAWDGWLLADLLNKKSLAAGAEQELWFSSDWTSTQGTLYEIITMTKSMLGLLVLLIVLVACFNLSSSLIMLVNEKRSDIAILLSQGLAPKQVVSIFLLQTFFIASTGLALGFSVALLLLKFLGDWIKKLEVLLQIDLTSAYPVHYLPSQVLFQDILLIIVSVFILSFLSSLYPARQAGKINPAEELKYE